MPGLGTSGAIASAEGYSAVLVAPPAPGGGTCATCRAPVGNRAVCCGSCARLPGILDTVLPISLSVAGGRLHRELRGYKDDPAETVRDAFTQGLAAVLNRFLSTHEACLATAAGVGEFGMVTTVPSRWADADAARSRLRRIVGRLCEATASRYERLLAPCGHPVPARAWRPSRYRPLRALSGSNVLLVDDTWTSGASAQAAAHALRSAGAAVVALVVIGRHVDPGDALIAGRLALLPPFDWRRCALGDICGAGAPGVSDGREFARQAGARRPAGHRAADRDRRDRPEGCGRRRCGDP